MKIWLRLSALVSLVALQCNLTFAKGAETMGNSSKTIRTYMNFSDEIDPAKILSMADLELSIALATPLVVFDEQRQIAAGLAERWEVLPAHQQPAN